MQPQPDQFIWTMDDILSASGAGIPEPVIGPGYQTFL
jgi:hypothetical protein